MIAGFRFSVRARPVAEIRGPGEPPDHYVRRLARAKAEAVWVISNEVSERSEGERKVSEDEIVLGADTVVVLDEHVLEKPVDPAGARATLRLLSGREHIVITGICLRHAGGAIVDSESTKVQFAPLEEREIEAYVASGEPMDKAGAYAVQGLASKFIDRIEGCYFNVMGLPLARVYRHLKTLGF